MSNWKSRPVLFLFAALVLPLFSGIMTVTVSAASFSVLTTTELIQAIEAANDEVANPGPDTIDLNGAILSAFDYYDTYEDARTVYPQITSEITLRNGTLARLSTAQPLRLLYIPTTGNLTLENVTVKNGNVLWLGGGVYNDGTLTVINGRFENNQAGAAGTAIYNTGSLTITGSTMTGNGAARQNGTILNFYTGIITINGSTFSHNTARHGSAIVGHGTVTINDTTFSNNTAEYGGAIWQMPHGYHTSFQITNSTFIQNTAAYFGGAIYMDDFPGTTTLTIDNSIFKENIALDRRGGAIYGTGEITITNSQFTGNQANHGGAIGFHDNTDGPHILIIKDSVLSGNSATETGGAVAIGDFMSFFDGEAIITNSLISGNTAATDGGAIHLKGQARLTVTSSTLAGNRADNTGGSIYNAGTTGLIARNSIIWGNNSPDIVSPNSTAIVEYSLLQSIYPGPGNLSADPLFAAPEPFANAPTIAGDYNLITGSLAIDAASNTAASSAGVGSTDIAGNPRYTNDNGLIDTGEGSAPVIDMGAYEFQGTSQPTVDVNRDSIVSPTDVMYIINRLGGSDLSADVDGDNDVDTDDLILVQNALGN